MQKARESDICSTLTRMDRIAAQPTNTIRIDTIMRILAMIRTINRPITAVTGRIRGTINMPATLPKCFAGDSGAASF